ncbi:MAG TPA: hypothetical protein VFM88_10965 [Vicinamibacteria bacterium]|nr:hypothetical protein [Vicinamibacteria bacterium]
MKSLVVGSVVAAVAMFFWGFLVWGVSPFPYQVLKPVADVPALQQALKATLPETGVYLFPHPSQGPEEELQKKVSEGAFGRVVFVREGATMGGATFGLGYLHNLVTALLLALLVRQAGGVTYGARLGTVVLAGLAGAIYSNLGKPIWYFDPWGAHVLDFAYDLSSYVVAGLVLAKLVKPEGR